MDDETACRLLGLDPRHSAADIDAAFRLGAHRAHPDHGGDPVGFRGLVEARDTLRASLLRPNPANRTGPYVIVVPDLSMLQQLVQAALRRLLGRGWRRVL